MNNKNNNDRVVASFLVIAIVTVMLVSYIVALGKFSDNNAELPVSTADEEPSMDEAETSYEESQTEDARDYDYYDSLSFESVEYDNSEVVNGALAVLQNSANGCAKVNEDSLVNISQHMTQNVYGLSTVALEIKKEAMADLDNFIVSFYEEVPQNGLIIVNGYTSPEKISTTDGLTELSSGYSVQFSIYKSSYSFSDKEFGYLRDQAYRYGMIQRYPSGKEAYTNMDANSSVYRYVGIAHSWYMNYYKYCLEEYVDKIKTEKVLEYDSEIESNTAYVVYYVPASTDSGVTEVPVPVNVDEYTVSGDGSSGFIVTVKVPR